MLLSSLPPRLYQLRPQDISAVDDKSEVPVCCSLDFRIALEEVKACYFRLAKCAADLPRKQDRPSDAVVNSQAGERVGAYEKPGHCRVGERGGK